MKFKIQMMTSDNYHMMMCGYRDYSIMRLWVEAESKEEAIAIAKQQNPDYIINDFVESEEEILEEERRIEEAERKAKAREAEKEAKKLAKELSNAESMGLTLEEYRKYKRCERNMKRHISDKKSCFAQIETLKRKIEYEERKIAEWEKAMQKVLTK